MSSDINITSGVFEGSCIETRVGVILHSYNDISGGRRRSINSDFASAVSNIVVNAFYINLSIFVALVFYISGHDGTVNLSTSAVFFNNGHSDVVVFIDRAFGWIEFETECVVRINNSQFCENSFMNRLRSCNDFDGGTNQRFISCNVSFGDKFIGENLSINNSFAVTAKTYIAIRSIQSDTIFVNILSGDVYSLAKCYFISNGYSTSFTRTNNTTNLGAYISSRHGKIKILSGAIVSYIEGSNSAVAAQQRNADFVFTRSQVIRSFFKICISVIEREYAISLIQIQITSSQSRIIWTF